MTQLVTGEAVALDLRPAALPSRLVAGAIDAVIVVGVLIAVLALASRVSLDLSGAAAAALTLTTVVLVVIGLPTLSETLWRGRTPGKAALGLRVVRDDGGPIGFRQALVRSLVGTVVERPGISLGLVAILTSVLHPQGKRLGDVMAGTIVLQERVVGTTGQVATMPPQLAAWAAGLDLSGMPQPLWLSVRQFVARSAQFTEAARATLGTDLLTKVLAATSPPPPAGTPGWAVLAAVLAERRRRESERAGSTSSYDAPRSGSPTSAQTPAPVPAPAEQAPPPPEPGPFALPR